MTIKMRNEVKRNWGEIEGQLVRMMFSVGLDVRTELSDAKEFADSIKDLSTYGELLNSYLTDTNMSAHDFEYLIKNYVTNVKPVEFIKQAREMIQFTVMADNKFKSIYLNVVSISTMIIDSYGYGHLVGVNMKDEVAYFDGQPTATTLSAFYIYQSLMLRGTKSPMILGLQYKSREIGILRKHILRKDLIGITDEDIEGIAKVVSHRDPRRQFECVSSLTMTNSLLTANSLFLDLSEQELQSPISEHSLVAYDAHIKRLSTTKDLNSAADIDSYLFMTSMDKDILTKRNVVAPEHGMILQAPINQLHIMEVVYKEIHNESGSKLFGVVKTLGGKRLTFLTSINDSHAFRTHFRLKEQSYGLKLILTSIGILGNDSIESTGLKFKSNLKKAEGQYSQIIEGVHNLLVATIPNFNDIKLELKPLAADEEAMFVVKDKENDSMDTENLSLNLGKNQILVVLDNPKLKVKTKTVKEKKKKKSKLKSK